MMATVFVHCVSPIVLELSNLSDLKRSGRGLRLAAGFVGAALGDQEVHQPLHGVVVGVADERRGFAYLGDQADGNQRLDVMGEASTARPLACPADGRPACRPGRRGPKHGISEPRRISEGFEAGGCVVDFHIAIIIPFGSQIKRYF